MASKSRLDQAAGASIGGFFSKTDESKPEQEQTTKESRKPPYTDEQMDEALKAVYRSDRQQDGADLLQINKGTFSRKKREIEENEPERVERLKAEVEAEKKEAEPQDTPQTTQKPQTAPEPSQPIENTPKEEKAEEKPNTKQKKQVFSFRATIEDIASWKAYATATGQTMENVGTAAMNEYLENHRLTGAEQSIFEAMKSRN
ncbi:MAG: hypothetical protein NC347_13295 [Clostridium sp.]|nr:hypothetical protein [Clostridium sp.]MCM1220004.1 hypothetical protein [Lachnospiraceae bacterium]